MFPEDHIHSETFSYHFIIIELRTFYLVVGLYSLMVSSVRKIVITIVSGESVRSCKDQTEVSGLGGI